MKRIGLIRMRYTPYGGAEVFLSRLVDGLIKGGHECHIFAREWDAGAQSKGNIDSRPIFHRVKTFGPSFLRILSFAVNSYFAIKKANLDVIISFDRTFYQDIYRAGDGCHREWLIQRAKGKGQRAKGFYSMLYALCYFLNPLHLTILHLERRLFKSRRLKFVIANSKRVKEDIIRHYGLPEDRIHVIYNGIDLKGFDPEEGARLREGYRRDLGLSPEDTLLLFVGSGFERKGLRFLIEAMVLIQGSGRDRTVLKGRNLRLLVIGKGGHRKYLKLARRLGVEGSITFKGPVKDVKGYYYASDIFVLPSVYEPFSNACLEAMAGGLPVVTSRANGVSEILADGEEGIIIENPTNPGEIAERIVPILGRDKSLEMGRAARNKVEGYSIERNVDETLRLIEEVGDWDGEPFDLKKGI